MAPTFAIDSINNQGTNNDNSTPEQEQSTPEKTADAIDNVTDNSNVDENVVENSNNYVVSDEGTKVQIPKDSDKNIVLDSKDVADISVSLPDEASNTEGQLANDGTVVYNTDNDVSVGVQAVTEESEGDQYTGSRQLITIENADAAKSYSFDYELPSGSKIVPANQSGLTDAEAGWYYILDKDGNLLGGIEPAWAKDANGNSVKTYYTVSGNTLTQVVEFSSDSVFPIVADPTTKAAKVGRKVFPSQTRTMTVTPTGQGTRGTRYSYVSETLGISYDHGGQGTFSVGVSLYGVGVSYSIPYYKGSAGGASVTIRIKDAHGILGHYYKIYDTQVWKVTPWVYYRKLHRGVQITNKGYTKRCLKHIPFIRES